MKITSGEFAGIPLFTPKNFDVRPTLSKTRQAVFNMLRFGLPGASCVDIFCGTGAFGFEALSNSAAKAVFIDNANMQLLLKNAEKLKLKTGRYEILTCDFEAGLEKLAKKKFKADFIFADPPYNSGYIIKLLKNRNLSDVLNEEGTLIIEAHKNEMTGDKEALYGWKVYKEKKYGDVLILLLKKGLTNG
jgi:16S rRNA (guanine966-N2)-methyltransferase